MRIYNYTITWVCGLSDLRARAVWNSASSSSISRTRTSSSATFAARGFSDPVRRSSSLCFSTANENNRRASRSALACALAPSPHTRPFDSSASLDDSSVSRRLLRLARSCFRMALMIENSCAAFLRDSAHALGSHTDAADTDHADADVDTHTHAHTHIRIHAYTSKNMNRIVWDKQK